MSIPNSVISHILMANGVSAKDIINSSPASRDSSDVPTYEHLMFDKYMSFQQGRRPPESSEDYQKIYSVIPTVYQCVRIISTKVAQLPIKIMQEKKEDVWEDVLNERDDLAVFRQYNSYHTAYDFWEQVIGYLELTGESMWLKLYDGTILSGLFPLRMDLMDIVPHNEDVVSHYIYKKGGEDIVIPSEFIFHLKYFNPLDHLRGLSPLAAAANEMTLDLYATTASKQSFEAGARPSGLIATADDIGEDSWQEMQTRMRKEYQGSSNAGKIMFLDKGFKWQQIQMTNKDMEYMEQRKWSNESIAKIFGVPPIFLMNFKEASVLANADVQYKLLWETIIPKLTKIEGIIDTFLIPQITSDRLKFKFDLTNVAALQPDRQKLSERFKTAVDTGAASPNDFREEVLGLERVDDEALNQHYISSTLIPISEIGNEEEGEEEESLDDKRITNLGETIQRIGGFSSGSNEITIDSLKKGMEGLRKSRALAAHRAKAAQAISQTINIAYRQAAKFIPVLIRLFNKQKQEILRNLEQNKYLKREKWTAAANFDFKYWQKEFAKAGEPHMAAVIAAAGLQFANSIDDVFLDSAPRVQAHIGTRTKTYATITNTTTKEQIDRILKKGIAEGWSIAEVQEAISKHYAKTIRWRATTVARTEMVGSANFGKVESMRQSGRVDKHTWATQRDSAVRENHSVLDGKTVKVGESFPVSGDYMGDPTYPSDINERCSTYASKVKPKKE